MRVSIHSISKTLYDGFAEKLICETPMGQMTVLDHHLPIISQIIAPSLAIVQKTGERTEIPVSVGFLEVRPESEVVILAQ